MLSDENKADYIDCILGKAHACIVIEVEPLMSHGLFYQCLYYISGSGNI